MLFNREETYISFLEVPTEISLSITVVGCPWGCEDCHSKHNWASNGEELTAEVITELLENVKGKATCITFMGGDWAQEELLPLLKIAKENDFKTALYAGQELVDLGCCIKNNLDYIKTGKYISELGGLNSKLTNQKFFKKEDGVLNDTTYIFQN